MLRTLGLHLRTGNEMTKSTWSEKDQRLVPGTNARTENDHLTLPGGKKPQELSSADLARVLLAAGIPGASHAQGREANLQAYANHLETMRKRAADNVVAEWIKAHP
jgi:hypothetical protein